MDKGQLNEAQNVLDNVKGEAAKTKAKARLFLIREIYAGPSPEELQVIRKDRALRDEGARKSFFSALELLGSDNPLVSQYHRVCLRSCTKERERNNLPIYLFCDQHGVVRLVLAKI